MLLDQRNKKPTVRLMHVVRLALQQDEKEDPYRPQLVALELVADDTKHVA